MKISLNFDNASYSEFRRVTLPEGALLFTSALAGEGKSFISSRLAIAAALRSSSKKPILYIIANTINSDADGLVPDDSKNKPGLIEILRGKTSLKSGIYSTNIPNFYLMPLGNLNFDFNPLLYLRRFKLLLEKLKIFNIFIDCGSVFQRNKRNFDPAEIAQMVDSTFLVVLSGVTPREVVLRSKLDLETAGANIQGVIMNDRFVKAFRSELADYSKFIELIPLIGSVTRYLRNRLGIY